MMYAKQLTLFIVAWELRSCCEDPAEFFCDISAEIPTVLPWSTRLNIAVDAAKGLVFLDADKRVIGESRLIFAISRVSLISYELL